MRFNLLLTLLNIYSKEWFYMLYDEYDFCMDTSYDFSTYNNPCITGYNNPGSLSTNDITRRYMQHVNYDYC